MTDPAMAQPKIYPDFLMAAARGAILYGDAREKASALKRWPGFAM